MVSILRVRKLRLRQVKLFVQGHSAYKGQSQNLKLESLLRSRLTLFECFISAPGTSYIIQTNDVLKQWSLKAVPQTSVSSARAESRGAL